MPDSDKRAGAEGGGRGIVLLVEDEVLIRMATSDMLNELGYQVHEAADGHEALSAIKSGIAVDVLMTDLKLPGMSGHQLVEAARRERPGLKVVVATGYGAGGGVAQGVPSPAYILSKPFQLAQLREAIQSAR